MLIEENLDQTTRISAVFYEQQPDLHHKLTTFQQHRQSCRETLKEVLDHIANYEKDIRKLEEFRKDRPLTTDETSLLASRKASIAGIKKILDDQGFEGVIAEYDRRIIELERQILQESLVRSPI